MQNRTFFHIGYPKTGTTFLQKKVFPLLRGINYLDHQTLNQIGFFDICNKSLDFDVDLLKSEFNEAVSDSKAPSLISYEGLCGDVYHSAANTRTIAHRIYDFNPNSQIIIIIRNQSDMIVSLYKQYVYQGGTMRFNDFMSSTNSSISFDLSYLNFYKMISLYKRLFGGDSVHVLLYEKLRSDGDSFLSDLVKILDISDQNINLNISSENHNPGVSVSSISLLRFLNRFVSSWANPNALIPSRLTTTSKLKSRFQYQIDPIVSRFFKSRNFIGEDEMMKQIGNYFGKGNKLLAEDLRIDLKAFKYVT